MNEKKIIPEKIKAIAVDIDGTIINKDELLSPRTITALQNCLKNNIAVILCTGRNKLSSEQYRKLIGNTGAMVYSNGAEIIDMPSGKVLCRSTLQTDIAVFSNTLAKKYSVYFQVFFVNSRNADDMYIVTKAGSPESQLYAKRTGLDIRYDDIENHLPLVETGDLHCIKGLYIASPENIEIIAPQIRQKFNDAVSVIRSWPTFLEILSGGISKGVGLLRALKFRGNIDPENVIAFGDEENDLSLFEAAGFSAAPANARDTVLAAADFKLASNNEDGVAQFLENLFCF